MTCASNRWSSSVFILCPATPGNSPIMVFSVAGGIDNIAELLATRGVEIVIPASVCPDGGLLVEFFDRDRNALSINQPIGSPQRC